MAIFVNTTQPRKSWKTMSSYGVMSGLHFQRPPFTQSKLVRCVKGRVITSITQRLTVASLSWMRA